MAWKAVLFDMDGVLIDSEEYMAKTGVRALKKYGIDAKESDFAEFVGCGENRYVGGVAEKYGVPYRTEMKDYLYACYGEHVKEEANIPDGVWTCCTRARAGLPAGRLLVGRPREGAHESVRHRRGGIPVRPACDRHRHQKSQAGPRNLSDRRGQSRPCAVRMHRR